MLRKIRIVLAAAMFIGITLLFLDFTGTLHGWLSWMAKIQLLPAVLALNVVVIVALAVLTLVFGRIYCSVICPLGILQDLLARLRRKKNKYSYSREVRWLRYPVLVVFIVALVAGVGSLFQLLAPYSAYGRVERLVSDCAGKIRDSIFAEDVQLTCAFLSGDEQRFVASMVELMGGEDVCLVSEPTFSEF